MDKIEIECEKYHRPYLTGGLKERMVQYRVNRSDVPKVFGHGMTFDEAISDIPEVWGNLTKLEYGKFYKVHNQCARKMPKMEPMIVIEEAE